MSYRKELEIDIDNLDVEWLNQSSLFGKYAKKSAEANEEVNRLEQAEKVLRSKLTLGVSADPGLLGDKVKPTAPNVEAYFRSHPEHIEVKKELIQAIYERDLFQGAVSAFRQRRDALTHLVTLHGQDYFSTPREPKNLDLTDAREKRKAKRAKRKIKNNRSE